MNKTKAIDYARIIDTLRKWGFSREEAESLFRIPTRCGIGFHWNAERITE